MNNTDKTFISFIAIMFGALVIGSTIDMVTQARVNEEAMRNGYNQVLVEGKPVWQKSNCVK